MHYQKEIIEIFSPLIEKFKLFPNSKDENTLELAGPKSVIEIAVFFGDIYVSIKKSSESQKGIEPMVWAYLTGQLNYKNLKPISDPENITLKDKTLSRLKEEYSAIKMFCRELLNGEFPDQFDFEIQKKKLLEELNEHFEAERKN